MLILGLCQERPPIKFATPELCKKQQKPSARTPYGAPGVVGGLCGCSRGTCVQALGASQWG